VGKVIPLFDEHDFWSHQPVSKYNEELPLSQFDMPVEVKTLADV
jgi:glycylpeptide N-tetradecanoyltransferase